MSATIAIQKSCSRCGTFKPRSEFYAHPYTADNLQSQCKPCLKRTALESRLRKAKERAA